jgi:hypothetical protein
LHESNKGRFDLAIGAGLENIDLLSDGCCCRFGVRDLTFSGNRIGGIDE